MEYKYKIKCDASKLDVNYINDLCTKHNPKHILLEFPNTKNMDTSVLKKLNPNVTIRIVDGYTEEKMKGAARADDYFERSLYTVSETIKIVEKIESIEKCIKDDWNDMQKLVYIYDILRRRIRYNHDKNASSKDKRSLRALISDAGVCAGYATVLKDILDRQGIKCDYVSGNGHAWNIVTINGKKYPIDVTWGNTREFAIGNQNGLDFLGQNVTQFNREHIPEYQDPNNGYQSQLSTIDQTLIKRINLYNAREKDYKDSTFAGTRDDGTRFYISQIGNEVIDGKRYYRYCYTEINSDNTKGVPVILYSDTNVMDVIDRKRSYEPVENGYEKKIINLLFSKSNIRNSQINGTNYIGGIEENNNRNINKPEDIKKDYRISSKFKDQTRKLYRGEAYVSPGLVIQKMNSEPIEIKGIKVYYYDIFEYVKENGKEVLKRNRVFSEQDLLKEKNKDKLVNKLLSRDRLDRKAKETGGYIGSLLEDGTRLSHRRLQEYFKEPSGKNKTNSELLDMLKDKENMTEFNSMIYKP